MKLQKDQIKVPVPSDIEISQSMNPINISDIAAEIGIVSYLGHAASSSSRVADDAWMTLQLSLTQSAYVSNL